MKNLSLTFCLAITALLGSVGEGFAANCIGKPSVCNYQELCRWATTSKGLWSTFWLAHVKEAKRRGLNCVRENFHVKRAIVSQTPLRSVFIKLSKNERKQPKQNEGTAANTDLLGGRSGSQDPPKINAPNKY